MSLSYATERENKQINKNKINKKTTLQKIRFKKITDRVQKMRRKLVQTYAKKYKT